jgi:hypothetical protein
VSIGTSSRAALVAVLLAPLCVSTSKALPRGLDGALEFTGLAAGLRIVDRPEIRSFPHAQRGVRTTRPRIILPRRVVPLLEDEAFSYGYTYCADAPGDIEPREGPYAAAPIPLPYCP